MFLSKNTSMSKTTRRRLMIAQYINDNAWNLITWYMGLPASPSLIPTEDMITWFSKKENKFQEYVLEKGGTQHARHNDQYLNLVFQGQLVKTSNKKRLQIYLYRSLSFLGPSQPSPCPLPLYQFLSFCLLSTQKTLFIYPKQIMHVLSLYVLSGFVLHPAVVLVLQVIVFLHLITLSFCLEENTAIQCR